MQAIRAPVLRHRDQSQGHGSATTPTRGVATRSGERLHGRAVGRRWVVEMARTTTSIRQITDEVRDPDLRSQRACPRSSQLRSSMFHVELSARCFTWNIKGRKQAIEHGCFGSENQDQARPSPVDLGAVDLRRGRLVRVSPREHDAGQR